jgi:hypothetical protein
VVYCRSTQTEGHAAMGGLTRRATIGASVATGPAGDLNFE